MSLDPSDTKPAAPSPGLSRHDIVKALAVGLFFVIASVIILELEFGTDDVSQLLVGDVAPRDIVAPASISFESQLATEDARNRAERLVAEVYSPPAPAVARQQRDTAAKILSLLDAIRTDPYATLDQKLDWIEEIEPLNLTRSEAQAILDLSDSLWVDTKPEVLSVLDQALSTEIREAQLPSVRRRLPLMVSASAPDSEAAVVLSITEDLVQANTFVDEARTAEARQNARTEVQEVVKTFEANEIIVREGEIITEEMIEALQVLGLQRPISRGLEILTITLWLIALTGLYGVYLSRYHQPVLKDDQKLALLVISMLALVVAVRAMVPNLTYAIPTAALAMIIAAMLDSRLAIVTTLMAAFILVFVVGGSLELLAYVTLTGLVVALSLGRIVQLHNLLWAGLYAILSNIAVIGLFYLFDSTPGAISVAQKLGGALLGGVMSVGVALVALLIIGQITNMTTYIQLLELSRPTHPLLADLLRRAPGTYHHSLLVSNLAEQAAERIGADAFLCRIGAYYHDVGKMVRPYFFTENTAPGMPNLHHGLDPETSAQILISHVTEGLELAKKHNLPLVIQSFIAEHHGTEVPGYFYHQAIKQAGGDASKVDRARFTYPGPSPQSKETAILMLADASEATVRAVNPQSLEEIEKIVDKTINARMESHQFDQCDLTMRDLQLIREAFIEVLKGVSHPRVKYPDQVNDAQKVEAGPLPPLPLAVQSAALSRLGTQAGGQAEGDKYAVPRE